MFICTRYEERVVKSMNLESIICDESINVKHTQHSVDFDASLTKIKL